MSMNGGVLGIKDESILEFKKDLLQINSLGCDVIWDSYYNIVIGLLRKGCF